MLAPTLGDSCPPVDIPDTSKGSDGTEDAREKSSGGSSKLAGDKEKAPVERVNAQELSGDPGRTLTYGLLFRRQRSSKTRSAKDKDIGDRDDRACTSETQKLLEVLAATGTRSPGSSMWLSPGRVSGSFYVALRQINASTGHDTTADIRDYARGRTGWQTLAKASKQAIIFDPFSGPSTSLQFTHQQRINEAFLADLKKEPPAQLVVVQGFSWSGR